MGGNRNAHWVLVGNPDVEGPFERTIRMPRWYFNIRVHFIETGWGGMN
jgi:hypothetical protein